LGTLLGAGTGFGAGTDRFGAGITQLVRKFTISPESFVDIMYNKYIIIYIIVFTHIDIVMTLYNVNKRMRSILYGQKGKYKIMRTPKR